MICLITILYTVSSSNKLAIEGRVVSLPLEALVKFS